MQPTSYIALRSIRFEPGETPADVPRDRWECYRPLSFVRRHAPELAKRLTPLTDPRRVYLISVSEGPHRNWARLWHFVGPGDLTLFTGGVFAVAKIVATGRSVALSRALEDDSKHGPFEYFIFLEKPSRIWIPYADFNGPAGFKRNYVVQGFNVIGAARAAGLIAAFPKLLIKSHAGRVPNKRMQLTGASGLRSVR